jgi:flagellar biosynthetic protein FliP
MTDTAELVHQVTQSEGYQALAPPLQTALFLGGLALLSTALVSVTAFTRIIIVLAFVRRALSTQEIPPNSVLIGLALFLTYFVMGPTLDSLYSKAAAPYFRGEVSGDKACELGVEQLRGFMLRHTRKRDLALFLHMASVERVESSEDTPTRVLVPAFMVSELKTAFLMGFCIYVPFLLIDLVVSTVLMSMGMMMMPPVVISTPFKILLFVLVDGWHLIARALSASFG